MAGHWAGCRRARVGGCVVVESWTARTNNELSRDPKRNKSMHGPAFVQRARIGTCGFFESSIDLMHVVSRVA